jgi:hypothetical protein
MPNERSAVFQYYEQLQDGRRQCKFCPPYNENEKKGQKPYASSTGTSTLWKHLRVHHGINADESQSEPLTPAEQEAITNAYIKWIVNDLQPFSTSDDPDFIEFVKLLNDKYMVPCRQTTKRLVMVKFGSYKELVREMLKNIP